MDLAIGWKNENVNCLYTTQVKCAAESPVGLNVSLNQKVVKICLLPPLRMSGQCATWSDNGRVLYMSTSAFIHFSILWFCIYIPTMLCSYVLSIPIFFLPTFERSMLLNTELIMINLHHMTRIYPSSYLTSMFSNPCLFVSFLWSIHGNMPRHLKRNFSIAQPKICDTHALLIILHGCNRIISSKYHDTMTAHSPFTRLLLREIFLQSWSSCELA